MPGKETEQPAEQELLGPPHCFLMIQYLYFSVGTLLPLMQNTGKWRGCFWWLQWLEDAAGLQ